VQRIGEIARVQIQREPLKVPTPEGSAHPRRFEPAPLLEVTSLRLTPDGATSDGVLDVHNIQHPRSRNTNGRNGVSVGFTSHYARMRERFGAHIQDGIAGENILVAADRVLTHDELRRGVVLQTGDGLVRLTDVIVAEPCVEFTRFALRFTPADPSSPAVTEGLQFLREGIRGFYATFAGDAATVRPGDSVFVLD
jgi:hypothetical protein